MGFIKLFSKSKKEAQPQQPEVPVPPPLQEDLFSHDITKSEISETQTQAGAIKANTSAKPSPEVPGPDTSSSKDDDLLEIPEPPKEESTETVVMEQSKTPLSTPSMTGADLEEEELAEEEKESIQLRKYHKDQTSPIYVEIDDYSKMLEDIGIVKDTIKSADNRLVSLQDIHAEKEKEFKKWHNALEDVERKLLFIDKVLFNEKG